MSIKIEDNLLSEEQFNHLKQLFASFKDSTLQQNIIELNAIKAISLCEGELTIQITMPFAWHSASLRLQAELDIPLMELFDATSIHWDINYQIATLKRANSQPAVKGVKNIIAVSSGKGGVGKSSISVNLALALHKEGARVGLLDADIYGPSIPHMLGAQSQRPTSPNNTHMTSVEALGIYTNSIGYLMAEDNATIWRGPMASSALTQLLQETLWPDLDYLILDMPPGTGDIQLTLSQQVPVTGAVVVTTPQNIALLDAVKGINMFNKVSVPVLGIIENMSEYICSQCGHHEAIFGQGGAQKTADKYQTKCLGHIPLHIKIREDLDRGFPTVVAEPDHIISQKFAELASTIAAELYWQGAVIPSEIMFTEVK